MPSLAYARSNVGKRCTISIEGRRLFEGVLYNVVGKKVKIAGVGKFPINQVLSIAPSIDGRKR
jgi:hypothetical protein